MRAIGLGQNAIPPDPPLLKGELAGRCACVLFRDGRLTMIAVVLVVVLVDVCARNTIAQPSSDSPMVRLLKSKRVPEDRQRTIVDLIGRRGSADDISYIYQQTLGADGF